MNKIMLIEFCLPVYNEEKILEKNVLTLLNYCLAQPYDFDWRIVVVINGSSDNSLAISGRLKKEHTERINFINIPEPGRGQALKKYWLQSQADILTYMDIDLAVSLDSILSLVQPIIDNQADLMIGSRLMPDSKISRSFIRELSSQSYNFLSRVILGHNFSDMQCGFKAIKSDAFKKIAPLINDAKWFFDTELIIFTKKLGFRVKEIPVDWSENRYDTRKSKVHMFRDSFKFFCDLIRLRIRLLNVKQ
jgi:glycosyltransferase involved in cell wall biosynthesis